MAFAVRLSLPHAASDLFGAVLTVTLKRFELKHQPVENLIDPPQFNISLPHLSN